MNPNLSLLLLPALLLVAGRVGAQEGAPAAIPFAEIGAKATQDYKGDAMGITATADGAELRTAFQKLAGTVTREGLWLESTETGGGRLQVIARAIGRASPAASGAQLPATGRVSVGEKAVAFIRPGLIEEYSVSVDGVRQDFIIAERPAGAGTLSVELALTGARAEPAADGARLILTASGRELAYNRLHVTDATGRQLTATLQVLGPERLAVQVEDAGAVYPVRIDPTFSDADWVSLNPSMPGANDWVSSAVVGSDGSLYIGGSFTVVGNIAANRIAKWDGSTWSPLGSGLNGSVGALLFNGADLYVGGSFGLAGGVLVNNIAKWNGSEWSALTDGVGGGVSALAMIGTDLYVAGSFTQAGGVTANRIAKWNGSGWEPLGTGVSGSFTNWISDLEVIGTDLFACGQFTTAGGVTVNHIAKWNGSTWSALGSGLLPSDGAYGSSLDVISGALFVGGSFTTAGGVLASNIAKWVESSWSSLNSGTNAAVHATATNGSELFVGGTFSTAGGVQASRVARWDGSNWSALGSGIDGSHVNQQVAMLAVVGTDVYAGGDFLSAEKGIRLSRWNGSTWSPVGPGTNGEVLSLAVSGGDLYAGGSFTTMGSVPANRISKWDGSAWSPLGAGMNDEVTALAISGGDLYAAGKFTDAGGVSANRVAKWNGNEWSALGTGMNGEVLALVLSGSDLYAGGTFTFAGGVSANRIAKWNGSAWNALGTGSNGSVRALAVMGSDLYAGGDLGTAGGITVNHIAKWNGSVWSALGTGMNSRVHALAVSEDNLYVGGEFTTAGGVTVNRIAKWNGITWSALQTGLNFAGESAVFVAALAVSGTDVYAGGRFATAGGVVASRIAKWNGSSWSTLGGGISGQAYASHSTSRTFISALMVDEDGDHLFVGGDFAFGGATLSPYIVQANLEGGSLDLSSLDLSTGVLNPAFSSDTTQYTVTLPYPTDSLTVTPTVAKANAQVKVNGVTVISATPSGAINLATGANTITLAVTGQDGITTKVYTVVATRLAAPVVTSPTSTSITGTSAVLGGNVVSDSGAPISVRGVVVAPTAVNSNPQIGGPGVTELTASGTTGVFTVNAAGLISDTAYSYAAYAVNSEGVGYSAVGNFVTATLPTVISPTSSSVTGSSAVLGGNVTSNGGTPISVRGVVFAPASVNNNPRLGGAGVTNRTTTGTTGVFTLNADSLTPGTTYAFAAYATSAEGTGYSINGGFTTLSNNANLTNLVPSAGSLSPGFSGGTTSYSASVSAMTASLTVTPTAAQANASVQVNGATVASGNASAPISLGYGLNTITVTVTAQDGVTIKIYSVAVTREAPVLLPAVFGSVGDVSLTSNGFRATGSTVELSLDFAPAPGSVLWVVKNTGLGFIEGTFGNLAQGQVVDLDYNGETYSFVANYFGGTGNDLVLWWAETVPVAWGDNAFGQLGSGGTETSLVPAGVSTAGAFAAKTIFAVAAGSGHSLALCSDGTLVAWGVNSSGQLGNNTTTGSPTPTLVAETGVLAGKRVVAIAAGNLHSLALCSDGTVVAWGNNSAGQLGNNSTTDSLVPVAVNTNGALSGKTVVAISAGNAHNLALCSDGTLVAWGDNSFGQLGNNSTVGSLVPVAVSISGLLSGRTVITMAAGYAHNLALCSDGTLATWGDNTYGQLGNGGNTDSLTPVAVSTEGVLTGKVIVNVAAGADHSLALSQDGTLAAWGWNGEGELGNNSTVNSNVPVSVIGSGALIGKTVSAVSAGEYHSIALATDGTLAAWGFGGNGQIGNGGTATRRVPTTVNMTALPSGSRFMATKSGMLSSHNLGIVAAPLALPVVNSSEANPVGSTTATLTGFVNPNGRATEVFFHYGPTTAYGSTTPSQFLPRGITNVEITAAIAGLSPSSAYHFQMVAMNAAGTTLGENVTFQTTGSGGPLSAPSVTTGGATDLTITSATLQGIVNPNGGFTNAYFDYGTTASYGSVTSNLGAGAGNSPVNLFTGITGLQPGTLYHYRLVAENSQGVTQGLNATFTTLYPPPIAATGGSEALSTTSVRVSGSVRARHASTQVVFEYGTDGVNFPSSISATPETVTGDADTHVTADLTNLFQGTTYYYRVRAVSVGGTSIGALGSFVIDVLSGLTQEFPALPPEAEGSLIVNLTPSGLLHGWRFIGEHQWRASGVAVGGLTTGDREIEFRPVPGHIHPPAESPVNVVSGGATTILTRDYYETAVIGSGGLSVTLKPDSITSGPDRAQWRLLGEDDTQWRDSDASLTGLIPGGYLIESKPVTGRATPPNANVIISAGQTAAPTITYFLASTATGALPAVLAFETVTSDQTKPYAYVGQIRSNAGSSTGFAVKERVVVTAAHVVWDDGTLSAVQGLQWLFQRHRGTYEPEAQAPRGFYLLAGYAAQRQAENSPGSFSPQSRNLDVAAMYFLANAARGGHGGFLASDLDANEFLLSDANKMLVGYPIDGIATGSQGRMHATAPGNIVFSSVGAAANRTYLTTGVRSTGGASGGPLCVQFDGGNYYPAAVYLGGTEQTLVRAIDSAVIDLFNRAELSGIDDQPHTGGGITHTSVTVYGGAGNPGSIKVLIEPAGAISAGAGWRLSPETSYRISGATKSGLNAGSYVLQLTTVAGYQVPAAQTVTVTGGQISTVTYSYELPMSPQESWRQTHFGTTANSGNAADDFDFDGDGFTNAEEYIAGTNPTLSGDTFKALSSHRASGSYSVSIAGKSERTYALERSIILESGSWITVATEGPLAAERIVTLTDTAHPPYKAFYRIRVTWP